MSINIKVSKNPIDVINRLSLLGLTVNQINEIGMRAITAKYNAVNNHPQNAGGMLAYIEGVKTLRDQLGSNSDWEIARTNNIETIKNTISKTEFAYCNVDYACDKSYNPQPISKKGKASKKAIDGNQLSLFDDSAINDTNKNYQLWYVLVSENNEQINVEVSLPTLMENGYFSNFSERIFCVIDAKTDDIGDLNDTSNEEIEYDDEIIILKK